MVSVLFVCSGNICRSPMAHALFQHMVQLAGLEDRIEVDSAGTGSWHVGQNPHRGTLGALKEHGISYMHRARQIRRADLSRYDYILAMDDDNLTNLRYLANHQTQLRRMHIGLFMDFAPQTGVREVPDPYYSGRFAEVYDLVQQASEGLLQHIREQHNL
jgi:protein-tyrosine phosphatase